MNNPQREIKLTDQQLRKLLVKETVKDNYEALKYLSDTEAFRGGNTYNE
ncbi:hypothetical protein 278BB001_50 [Bacillus phage 278BB001]|nr:hypothetical protein 278BB001_50 [Bacillus phage 278BB001]